MIMRLMVLFNKNVKQNSFRQTTIGLTSGKQRQEEENWFFLLSFDLPQQIEQSLGTGYPGL